MGLVLWWWGLGWGKSLVLWLHVSLLASLPLDCELHWWFSAFLSPHVWEEGYSKLELDISLPSGQLVSDNIPADLDLVTSFFWGQVLFRRTLYLSYFKWFISPFPYQNHEGFFSDMYCATLVELLDTSLTKLWEGPWPSPPIVFNSQELFILSLQQFISHSSGFLL